MKNTKKSLLKKIGYMMIVSQVIEEVDKLKPDETQGLMIKMPLTGLLKLLVDDIGESMDTADITQEDFKAAKNLLIEKATQMVMGVLKNEKVH